MEGNERILLKIEITDKIRQFYELNNRYDGTDELLDKMRLIQNAVSNQMDTYIKSFNNEEIAEEYKKEYEEESKETEEYTLYMNKIKLFELYLVGKEEDLEEKTAKQVFNDCMNWEGENGRNDDN